jgi:hypothetical protein
MPMTAPLFMFATGIENSYPTIHNGRLRVDELEKCGHYTHWRTDFDLLDDLNVHTLRYGPPIHTTWLGQGRYDWEFSDLTFGELRRRNIIPIVDLCHFGRVLGCLRLVERATHGRSGLHHGSQAHRQSQRACDVRHPGGAG